MDTPLTVTDKLASALDAGWRDEAAVTAIEYGLLAALIVVASLGAFTNLSLAIVNLYQSWVIPVLSAV